MQKYEKLLKIGEGYLFGLLKCSKFVCNRILTCIRNLWHSVQGQK